MSSKEFLYDLLQPGETIVFGGKRGKGKTATALSIAQHAVQGDYGHRHVEIITNVLFGRVTGKGDPVEDYPEHVHHEDTLAGTMRRIGGIIGDYGSGNCLIIWLLDEAQNFMMADMNGTKENLALTKYLGNARKFDVCNMFLTPAINNLTPRVRCFPTGEQKSGYCSCQMVKDPDRASEITRAVDPRSITFVRTEAGAPPVPLYIKPTSWIRGIYARGLEPGSYGYDTKSTASFAIGQNDNGVPFSFERFIMATSGGLSHELPRKIERFFEEWDSEGSDDQEDLSGEDYGRIRIADQCRRVQRMRDRGLTWRDIAAIEDEAATTIQSRFYKFTGYPSSNPGTARNPTTDDTGSGRAGAYIYNPKRGTGPGGLGSSAGGGLRCSGGRRRKRKRRAGSNRRANLERRGGGPARTVARMHRKVGGNVHGRRSVNLPRHPRRSNSNR